MKVGLPASLALHAALIAWVVVSLPSKRQDAAPAVDAMPVEFVPIAEATQLRLGQKTAKPKEEIVAKDTAKAAQEKDGQRAGTSKQEEPPPAPPEVKPREVAKVEQPKDEPKPPAPKPEPKPVAKPEPKDEPKPKEAEKAKDVGEGKPPEVKEPKKDEKALDKIIEKAEKKPDPPKPDPPKAVAKPLEKKPEPVKTAAVQPTQPSPAKSDFDARNISDILNRNRTGTSAATEPRTASLGSPNAQRSAVKMTQNELDGLRGQVQRCWTPPVGSSEANLVVAVRFTLNPDGTLNSRPATVEAPAHPMGPSLARSAERAVAMCAPYKLPADKYAAWSDIILDFDPRMSR